MPFVCGATDLGEALRRISEGAAMIRSKGEAGTGNVVEATRHMRADPRRHQARWARSTRPSCSSRPRSCARRTTSSPRSPGSGKLPVVLFTAGGIATPADAAMMMQLGAEGVFVGSGIFKSGDPAQRAAAIVQATTFHDDPDVIAKVSRGLGEADGRHQRRDAPRERAVRHPRLVSTPIIGVLALQGDVREHLAALRGAGAEAVPVRRPEELAAVDGLVLPGGESTTIVKLADRFGLLEPLRAAVRAGCRSTAPAPG